MEVPRRVCSEQMEPQYVDTKLLKSSIYFIFFVVDLLSFKAILLLEVYSNSANAIFFSPNEKLYC